MKRNYIIPSVTVICTIAEEMICQSPAVKGAFNSGLTVGADERDGSDTDEEDLW